MNTTTLPSKLTSLLLTEFVGQLYSESEVSPSLVYCFPKRLIACFESIKGDVAPSLLDKDSVSRELRLAELLTQRDQIAFRKSDHSETYFVVSYRYLGDIPGPIKPEDLRLAGSKHPQEAADEFNSVFEPYYLHVQGYCGWLLQQESYWRDLRTVIGLFGDELKTSLLPQQTFSTPKQGELVEGGHAPTEAYKTFCEKWRLQGLATLDLPVVVAPQLTSVNLYNPRPYPGCVSPFLPDIFPLDSGKPISKALDQARLGIDAPHLTEWKEMIAVGSRKKRTVHRFAYEFRLQHYWRILLQRYPKQVHKRKPEIAEAFARYFADKAARTIEDDSQKISVLLNRDLSTHL